MVDKLSEIGSAFTNIFTAVKVANSLQGKNRELLQVIEQTKRQGEVIDKLQFRSEPLLDELKKHIRKLLESAAKMETWFGNFGKEISSFDKFVRTKIKSKTIPNEIMEDFCEAVRRIHSMATGFSDSFERFIKNLSKSQETAVKMVENINKKEEAMQKQASSAATKGGLGTAGLVLAGAGLVALGFFTGGAAWVAAGIGAGAAFGAGAVGLGVKTLLDVKKMREQAGEFLKDANVLEAIGKNLKGISDKAGEIKMDEEALENLKIAMGYFKDGQEKEKEALEMKVAELEAKLRKAGLE